MMPAAHQLSEKDYIYLRADLVHIELLYIYYLDTDYIRNVLYQLRFASENLSAPIVFLTSISQSLSSSSSFSHHDS